MTWAAPSTLPLCLAPRVSPSSLRQCRGVRNAAGTRCFHALSCRRQPTVHLSTPRTLAGEPSRSFLSASVGLAGLTVAVPPAAPPLQLPQRWNGGACWSQAPPEWVRSCPSPRWTLPLCRRWPTCWRPSLPTFTSRITSSGECVCLCRCGVCRWPLCMGQGRQSPADATPAFRGAAGLSAPTGLSVLAAAGLGRLHRFCPPGAPAPTTSLHAPPPQRVANPDLPRSLRALSSSRLREHAVCDHTVRAPPVTPARSWLPFNTTSGEVCQMTSAGELPEAFLLVRLLLPNCFSTTCTCQL